MSIGGIRTVTDCHAHVWGDGGVPYPFGPLDGLAPPESPATTETLLEDMAAERVTSVVLIQPRIYGYDHAYLYEAARSLGERARAIPLLNVARRTNVSEIRRLAADPHTAAAPVIALGREAFRHRRPVVREGPVSRHVALGRALVRDIRGLEIVLGERLAPRPQLRLIRHLS
jgi:hypothetical protein